MTQSTVQRSLKWTVADITATVVIAVASGIVFWGFGFISKPISALFTFLPGADSLSWGVYYIAGPLAAIIVRKPGAALFAELVGGVTEALLGSHWGGLGTILPGLVQGIGAEIAFAIFAYKVWNLASTTLSGALSGFAGMAISWPMYYAGEKASYIAVCFAGSIISGAIIAGVLMWFLYRALFATGALERLAGGRA